ncbi:leucine--tRNA ligase [Cochleicola gelatinilyticus]|uniref:Leucine--tRNA ligase n=1 Tax=Cochleicola gelatinilyticus TaxID=1763537 RepID=A0A167ISP9_9FLAO|nr:leucine--tRNA ligase [Cochleicola gelatinilyticus]OAB79979.1 leucine--tRNA ligase [Cochleicola gelatinilyticus]
MSKYHFNEIEAKWQQYWSENQTFKAQNPSAFSSSEEGDDETVDKPKFYVLDMFPYPSGAGLHVGHPLGYIASDVYARFKRHQGFNVLHPMGYDSFGLPAEQYAIQTGQHPAETTKVNIEGGTDKSGTKIEGYRKQLDRIGFSFDWSREVRTSNPGYYKWTQWIFIQLFESWYDTSEDKARPISELKTIFSSEGNSNVEAACDEGVEIFSGATWNAFSEAKQQQILLQYRLTYLAETEVNWCPELGTVLANDEIVNGVSERGGFPVIRKKMKQWSMRITAYAQRLLDGLDTIDWPQSLKDSQTNWIGRSKGAEVTFKIKDSEKTISVFTTRPDTIYGVSFMTLAPELDLVKEITTQAQKAAVEAYIDATAKRSERDRMADVKTITGAFTGAYAEHPFTGEAIPIWIGDYVLAGYGTGAVMSVPCGDQRDYDFAKHFNIPIPNIFEGVDISEEAFSDKATTVIANSDFLNGLSYKEATQKAIEALEAKNQGEGKINYRLRDAVFSRQRYWGEPFPVYYKNGMPQMIAKEHLPLVLPEVEKYLPTEEGEPPLGRADVWAWDTEKAEIVSNDLINNETVFPLELNTMPGWAGSSCYMFRYMDPDNNEELASEEKMKYWENVDLYIGGSEHATSHLLYSRFWVKFMYDRGNLLVDEPVKKLINQGMILGESAFVHRIEGENKFVTESLLHTYKTQPIHVDVSLVDHHNNLDINGFTNWREDFKNAEFITENDGTFKVVREVEKMSKSKYNVVSPDDICSQYGADTLRLYEMFLGPLEQAKPWSTAGITGVHSFLKKLWKLYHSGEGESFRSTEEAPSKDSLKTLHKTIKKVQEDIENFSFNTSVSTFMIAVNELTAQQCTSREILEPLVILISPYAPHIAEELWQQLGHSESIATASFPKFEASHLVESSKEYPISFNGKMRFTMELPLDMSKDDIESAVMAHEKTARYLEGRTPKKVIVVPGKIVNIVG